jgi:1-deoxy-D-xylulose-5-phosphate synthase
LSDLGLQTPVIRIGWPDQFIEHGKAEVLRAKYGISVESTLQKLHRTFEQRAAEKPAHTVAKAQLG